MKICRLLIIPVAFVELVLIAVLLKRGRAQEERLVAASSAVIVQQEHIYALRRKIYGDSFLENHDPKFQVKVSEAYATSDMVFLWYEWMRAYGYGEKGADGTPKFLPHEELLLLDVLALPNYVQWVDEAYLAQDSSKAIFGVFYNDLLKAAKIEGTTAELVPIPEGKFGKELGFNLPRR